MYNQNSATVKFYGEKILADPENFTIANVPNLFNLREEVQKYIDARQSVVTD